MPVMKTSEMAGPTRRVISGVIAEPPQNRGEHKGAGRDPLGQQVQGHVEAPRLLVRRVVVDARLAGPRAIRRRRSERAEQHLSFFVHEGACGNLRLQDALVRADIEDLRDRPLLRLPARGGLALRDQRDLARRIVEIAEDAAFGRAHADAGRQQIVLDPVRAEVALLGGPRVRIDEQLIVGARHHARPAADA